ncbi:MAG: nucleoside triphosphate pyrophosphohydrolase [Chloroflexota bacterium]|nr:nucleoside triphosphate pyrophosphohydrolase [Chloroflexota bacterium]
MSQITIVGMGPGGAQHLTREAWQVLAGADEIWLRTLHHPGVEELPQRIKLFTFDAFYEEQETFEQVYRQIATKVLALGKREQGVIYAVPGHPLVGESAVLQILREAQVEGISTQVVAGLSFIEPVLTALEIDALDGLQIMDALAVMALQHPPLNPDFPALIGQIYNQTVASELKMTLMNQYPDEHEVVLVEEAGTGAQQLKRLSLYEVDRQPVGLLSALYVPSLPTYNCSFEVFQAIIARLRAPGGCPWDRQQTHASLRDNLLEEAYEVLEAIDRGDEAALQEELGDLLLQVGLHAQIATEYGEFRMSDVIAGINAKLQHRHPHVWGEVEVEDVAEVHLTWEALKQQEREAKGQAARSLLDGVPKSLPALAQAYTYGNRARNVGFTLDIQDLQRRVNEFLASLDNAQPELQTAQLGELLFSLVDWARLAEIDPESALREANLQFAQRFQELESVARQQGLPLAELRESEKVTLRPI